MGIAEPEHLVGVVKACPRPFCRSADIKWRYYNNAHIAGAAQPRYECKTCKRYWTHGGKIRFSKEEKQALLREAQAEAAAKRAGKEPVKLTALERNAAKDAAKTKAAKRAAKEAPARELPDLEPPRRTSERALRRTASPTTFQAPVKVPRIRLRLTRGAVIDLPSDSKTETLASPEVDAGAGARPAAVMQEGDQAALDPGPTVPELPLQPVFDMPLDMFPGLVGRWESGVADGFASGAWEAELEALERMELEPEPEWLMTL